MRRDGHQVALCTPQPNSTDLDTAGHKTMPCSPHTSTLSWPPKSTRGNAFIKALLELSSDLSNPTPSCKSSSYHCRRFPPLPLIYHLLDLNSPLPTCPQSSPSPGAKGPALALLCKAFAPSTHSCPFPPAGASQTLLPAGAGPGCGHLSAQHPAHAWQRAAITE